MLKLRKETKQQQKTKQKTKTEKKHAFKVTNNFCAYMRLKFLSTLSSANLSAEEVGFCSPPLKAAAASCEQPVAEKHHPKEVLCHQISNCSFLLAKILFTNEKHSVYHVIIQNI